MHVSKYLFLCYICEQQTLRECSFLVYLEYVTIQPGFAENGFDARALLKIPRSSY